MADYIQIELHDNHLKGLELLHVGKINVFGHILKPGEEAKFTFKSSEYLRAARLLDGAGINYCASYVDVEFLGATPGELLNVWKTTKDIVYSYQGEKDSLIYMTKARLGQNLCRADFIPGVPEPTNR